MIGFAPDVRKTYRRTPQLARAIDAPIISSGILPVAATQDEYILTVEHNVVCSRPGATARGTNELESGVGDQCCEYVLTISDCTGRMVRIVNIDSVSR